MGKLKDNYAYEHTSKEKVQRLLLSGYSASALQGMHKSLGKGFLKLLN